MTSAADAGADGHRRALMAGGVGPIRLGTRRSTLALAQAREVAAQLGDCELVPTITSGDSGRARGDKSRWVLELEQALLREEIDLAVHSAKDVPTVLAEGLALLGTPPRAPAEDVLCGADTLEDLRPGAVLGTSSLRRAAQLRAAREDLEVAPLRGNVDTRLSKLAAGGNELDGVVLARAGLRRLGREEEIGTVLDPARFVPAPGQGVLALQGRADDPRARRAAASVGDAQTHACLRAERALARALGASCNTPLGAHALPVDGSLVLRAWVGLPDGSAWLADELHGAAEDPEQLGGEVARRLSLAGAGRLLAAAEELATGTA
jgi:hydroxymethylbilane synthase